MYILKCSDGSYYTGSTIDIEKRMVEHNDGRAANYTRKRLPIELVYLEEYLEVSAAFVREKQVQGWSRKKKEALIKGQLDSLSRFSECANKTHYKHYKESKQ